LLRIDLPLIPSFEEGETHQQLLPSVRGGCNCTHISSYYCPFTPFTAKGAARFFSRHHTAGVNTSNGFYIKRFISIRDDFPFPSPEGAGSTFFIKDFINYG